MYTWLHVSIDLMKSQFLSHQTIDSYPTFTLYIEISVLNQTGKYVLFALI